MNLEKEKPNKYKESRRDEMTKIKQKLIKQKTITRQKKPMKPKVFPLEWLITVVKQNRSRGKNGKYKLPTSGMKREASLQILQIFNKK